VPKPQIPTTHEQVIARYHQRLAEQQKTVARCNSQWSKVAWLRGVLILLFFLGLFFAINDTWQQSTLLYTLSGILFLAAASVAVYVDKLERQLRSSRLMARVFRESIARCERKWSEIEVPKVDVSPELRAVSADLDLFTDSSIFKLLGITRTPLGTETLVSWIREGANPQEVMARQEAVRELAPRLQWREEFQLLCEQLSGSHANPQSFVDWAQSPNWFEGRRWLLTLVRITALASIALFLSIIFQLIPLTIAGPSLLCVMAVNFIISVFYSGAIHEEFNKISTQANEAGGYVELFNRVANCDVSSTRLMELANGFKSSSQGAQKNIGKLGKLTSLASLRRGSGFILYLLLEFLFFWDAHVLDLMEKWKSKSGSECQKWFADLGEWETLCALAKLAGDEPTWTYPKVAIPTTPDAALISGTNLAHPLLGQERVANSVQVGPPGTVLLVTGSNMSGKSTLLRSIGANAVLAQMGTVVCADEMTLPPLKIETSMRIADSLADGVSFFMAELKRLKQIVDQSETISNEENVTMLFLLDEILQGTNSTERQIAVSRVVRKLIDSKAIGCISTHDLDLADTDELNEACQTVHFSEQFSEVDGKKKMTFDYQMKQGIAQTTNALKLLEMVGLGEK
jgi:ABC-type multidrug transport system fused ATPase/permease subunit